MPFAGKVVEDLTGKCVVPPSGLVGWWPLEDAGQIINSVNGNQDGGVNAVTSVPGKMGKALEFNGQKDNLGSSVTINDNPYLNLGKSMTVAAWVKVDGLPEQDNPYSWARIVGKGVVPRRNYGLWISGTTFENTKGKILFHINGITSNAEAVVCQAIGGPISLDNWHFLVGTYDGQNIKLYIDNQLVNTQPCSHTPTSNGEPLVFGKGSPGDFPISFNGAIDEVMILNKPLTAEEISSIYTAPRGVCTCSVLNTGSVLHGETDLACNGRSWIPCDAAHIVLISSTGTRCFQIDEEEYEWKICKANDNYLQGVHVCSAGTWTECNQLNINRAKGNYYCSQRTDRSGRALGYEWKTCGEAADVACVGDTVVRCDASQVNQLAESSEIGNDYYCSNYNNRHQWIKCDQSRLGQGVENAAEPGLYAGTYVCGKSTNNNNINYAWVEIQCRACFGAQYAGTCIGSNAYDVHSGILMDTYYEGEDAPITLVGCVNERTTEKECYFVGEENSAEGNYPFDALVEEQGGEIVCGLNHNWLKCPDNNNPIPFASDGGRWLCENSEWTECTSTIAQDSTGRQGGNYVCSFDAERQKWRWFSEFSCSPTSKYKTKDDSTAICDGANWLKCPEIPIDPVTGSKRNPFATDPNVNFACNEDGSITISENICSNAGDLTHFSGDDDNDGFVDRLDPDCQRSKTYILGTGNVFEVILPKGDRDVSININENVVYDEMNLCDLSTQNSFSDAALCQKVGDQKQEFLIVTSTTSLRTQNQKPLTQPLNTRITFLYEQGGVKKVSVLYTADVSALISESERTFPITSLQANLVNKQRAMLKQDGEFYLLWLNASPEQPLFDESKLVLTHIPLGINYPAEAYTGTTSFVFRVLAGKSIVMTKNLATRNYVFSSLAPGEAPAAYVVPTTLFDNMEVSFTKTTPVQLTDVKDGTLSICRDDNDADPQLVRICQNNVFKLNLRRGELTTSRVARTDGVSGSSGYSHDIALLFDVENNTKKVSIFSLLNPMSMGMILEYNDFINAMVQGRRIAFAFNGQHYLLQHPIQPLLDLTKMSASTRTVQGATTFAASGSQDKIEFGVFDGARVYLQRQYGGEPPYPFTLKALRRDQVTPVDLERDFSTSVSSVSPVTISSNANFLGGAIGTVQVDTSTMRDIARYQPTFKLSGTFASTVALTLSYRVPRVDGDVLYYYHSAQIDGAVPIKTASIYRIYDINQQQQEHTFDDTFLSTFIGGSEIALKFQNSYYLLGHQGVAGRVAFYDPSKLTLRSLTGTATYPVAVSQDSASFTVPEGTIIIRVDVNKPVITFRSSTGIARRQEEQLAAAGAFADFTAELNATNSIRIGASTLRMCFIDAFADYPSVKVCDVDAQQQITAQYIVNPYTVIKVSAQKYVLESNLQRGNAKKVTIHKIIPIQYVSEGPEQTYTDDWFSFAREITAGRKPLLNLSSKLYFPSVDGTRFDMFGVAPYSPLGPTVRITNITQETPITQRGVIILGSTVITAEQRETGNEETPVELHLQEAPYKFLPEDPLIFNLTEQSSETVITFVTVLNGKLYNLAVLFPLETPRELVRLLIMSSPDEGSDDELILHRFFTAGDSKTIYLDGIPVELKVLHAWSEATPSVVISIRRVR